MNATDKAATTIRNHIARDIKWSRTDLVSLIKWLRSGNLDDSSAEWAYALSAALIAPNAGGFYQLTFRGRAVAGFVSAPLAR